MTQSPLLDDAESLSLPDVLPLLPLKDTVVFPYIILPLSLGAEKSLRAVDYALGRHRLVMLVTQRDPSIEEPDPSNLFDVGTVAMIMRMLRLPDGRSRILVQGLSRARLERITRSEPFLQGRIASLSAGTAPKRRRKPDVLKLEALMRSVKDGLEQAVHLGRNLSPEVMVVAANLDDPGRLADLVASNLELELEAAQDLLETPDPVKRLRAAGVHLQKEIRLLDMQNKISSQARDEIDKSQREYFLRQQLKAIYEELGEKEDVAEEIEGYRKLAEEKKMPEEACEELEKQVRRLQRSHPDSAETTVIRTYLDWLTSLPWARMSDDNLDLDHAREVLDEDHYNLDKVKERILEFLAVRKLKADSKGPILCFVGPPGVGKTSLGRSIARAMGRCFTRLSLGGVRDEAEIRGHRRTYVGAMPGRIVQGLHQAGTGNPVFMLDEIDKIGSDFRGDPSSALLEVLDPEQNHTFRDHYLGVPYDLSQVIFITTANLLDPIPPAFLDRLEVLRLSGYTEEEKLEIARRHLIPKQLRENGLGEENLRFTEPGLSKIIRGYTREAGLRNLEREIGAVCRKVAVRVARGKDKPVSAGVRRIERFLGPEKHFQEALLDQDRIGVATGLAWTSTGGDLMLIEVTAVPGKGKLTLTGQLGDVMKESAQAALSYARTYAARTGQDADFFSSHDLHVHVPAGSTPKDGPSAGITVAAAILSILTGRPVDRKVAMTGEITLRGEVLPIGGLKEKALAARAAGLRDVVLPELNRRDVPELPAAVKRDMRFHFVREMDEVLEICFAGKGPKKRKAGKAKTGRP